MKKLLFSLVMLLGLALPAVADDIVYLGDFRFTGNATMGKGWFNYFGKNMSELPDGFYYDTRWEYDDFVMAHVYNDNVITLRYRNSMDNYQLSGFLYVNGHKIGIAINTDEDSASYGTFVATFVPTKALILGIPFKNGDYQLVEMQRVDGDIGVLSKATINGYYTGLPFSKTPPVNTYPAPSAPSYSTPSTPGYQAPSNERHCTTCYGTGVCQTCGGDGITNNPYYPSQYYECPNCKENKPQSSWGKCPICHGTGKLGH